MQTDRKRAWKTQESGGDAGSAVVAVACVIRERRAAARAIPGGLSEPPSAIGAEYGVGLGPCAMFRTFRSLESGARDSLDRRLLAPGS